MIKIYNTATRSLEEFKPVEEGKVGIYVCGPTVYNYIHIGNARPIIFFDTVRRYFEYSGYDVNYVSNFTDIDDKLITKSNETGETVKQIAQKYIKAFLEDTGHLNIKEEGMTRPKATEHIKEMISLVKTLEEKGYAYAVDGDVYFDVEAWKNNYPKLINQSIDDLVSGARIEINEKKQSALDFTLWKSAKEGEPFWGSPWGKGRPGWHLECSAMSKKYLGDSFDIHGGGIDLVFPHHENEVAQSTCAYDGEFARYWMHNGYLNIKGEKMSKSTGNFLMLRDVLDAYEGRVVRFFMLNSHYRKPIDFSDEELTMAKAGLERIENSLIRFKEVVAKHPVKDENFNQLEDIFIDCKKRFEDSMDEDFNTGKAIGVIFELIKESNKTLDKNEKIEELSKTLNKIIKFIIVAISDVIGVKLNLDVKISLEENYVEKLLKILNIDKFYDADDLLNKILDARINYKKEKDFAKADQIRDELAEIGIIIKDGREGTSWKLER